MDGAAGAAGRDGVGARAVSRRRRGAVLTALVVAAVVATLGLVATGGAAGTLLWRDCGSLECASLAVPLRYDRPGGATLTIETMRAAARDPARRIGSLVVNFGGPGSSGRDYLGDFAGELPAVLRDRFDIVLYDPRGVGRSAGIACALDVPALLDLDDRISPLSEAELARRGWETVKPCVEPGTAPPIQTLGTVNAARDLDRLRAALGDDRLTYLGFSYGTRLGSVYAHLFPRRVRALVLDGAVTPSADWRKLSIDSAASAEDAFRRFFRACRAGCASRPVEGLWRTAVRRLTDEPIVIDGHEIGPAYLELVASLAFGAGREALESLGGLVQQVALGGNGPSRRRLGSELAGYLRQAIGNGSEVAARLAIDCADLPDRPSDAAVAAFDRTLRARFPLAGPTSDNACPRQWPKAIEPLPRVVAAGAPPIVVVGTRLDPVTPYRWAVELAAALRTGVLVTAERDTHTSFAQGDRCLDDLVSQYLLAPARPRVTRCG